MAVGAYNGDRGDFGPVNSFSSDFFDVINGIVVQIVEGGRGGRGECCEALFRFELGTLHFKILRPTLAIQTKPQIIS